jgi:hypothetical protein
MSKFLPFPLQQIAYVLLRYYHIDSDHKSWRRLDLKRTIKIGLLCVAVLALINQFADIPFLSGLLAGAGVCFLMAGALPQKTVDKLERWKRAVFHRD